MARAIGLLGTNTAQGCSPGTAARTCTWGFVPHPTLPGRGIDPRRRSGVTALARNSCTAEIADPVSPSAGSARFEVKHRTGGLRSGGIKRATESWRGRYGWQRQRWQEQQDSRIQERQRKATGKERQEGREGHSLNLMGTGLGLVNPPSTLG